MHLVEMRSFGAAVAHAEHVHAKQLAALGEVLSEEAEADDHEGLVFENRLVPLVPSALRLVALHPPKVAVQRDHVEKRKLAHLWPMDAAGRGEHDMRRE